jgi:hypothetical protein
VPWKRIKFVCDKCGGKYELLRVSPPHYWCRKCKNELSAEWRIKHPNYWRDWYLAHKDEILERRKAMRRLKRAGLR